MIRKRITPRPNAAERHEEIGFRYHHERSSDGEPYWRESAAYEFTLVEVEAIESATEELHQLCLALVDDVVTSGDYPAEYGLGDAAKSLIERSWRARRTAVYGRFDLLFESPDRIKLYEYNADTPTALLEAAVAQWLWVEEAPVPNHDQFNSIHEKLVERWRQVLRNPGDMLHLFAMHSSPNEDWGNISYMAEVAMQAGWQVTVDDIENIGYNETGFVDAAGEPVRYAFKLYPWEWMMDDEFGEYVAASATEWFEPPWKMLLSNKAVLPLLWARETDHPNLLPAFFEETNGFIKKPTLSREGANVYRSGWLMEGSHFASEYDTTYVYQEYAPLPDFEGHHPSIGSWVIGNQAAGMGIREDRTLISGNGSHFVPHYFVEENQ
jgi:glutathionylspermidine synthase